MPSQGNLTFTETLTALAGLIGRDVSVLFFEGRTQLGLFKGVLLRGGSNPIMDTVLKRDPRYERLEFTVDDSSVFAVDEQWLRHGERRGDDETVCLFYPSTTIVVSANIELQRDS